MTKSKYNNHLKFLIIIISLLLIVTAAYVYTVQKQQTHLKNMVTYHTKMIKSGSISSLVQLGKMYEKGEGVEKNLKKANELFNKAINFNKYLDEIMPNTSDNELNIDDENVDLSNKKTTDALEVSKINNNFTKFDSRNTIDNFSSKPKFIPYIKKENIKNRSLKSSNSKDTFNNVIIIDKNNGNKTRQFSNKKQRKKSSDKRKKQLRKRKKRAQAKARARAKRVANAKARARAKKTAKARAYAKSSSYKKTLRLKNTQTKVLIKKPRFEAKRSPRLNEERPDVNLDLEINEEKVLSNSENDKIVSVQQDNSQTVEENFTSNPCNTASSKYIAKCRRLNKRK